MPKLEPLFGLVFSIDSQRQVIDKYCFGECGRVLFAGMDGGDGIGALIPCSVDDCPFEEKRTDEPIGDINGRPVFIRKLIERAEK
jgi:hypothetical protein